MTIFTVSCLIGYLIITTYTIYVMINEKGIPESISSGVYQFSESKKWVFSLIMLCVAAMIMPQLLIVSKESTQPLAFAMCVGLMGVGADPLSKDSKNVLHYVSAAICGLSSQFLIAFNNPILLLLWAPYVIYTLVWEFSGKNMFIAELIMMLGIGIMCFF